MSLTSKIALIIIIVLGFSVIIKFCFEKYKQSYFASQKFIELSRYTDDVLTLYEQLKDSSYQLKQFISVNFSPSSIDEIEMRNFRGDNFKREQELPALTYLCTEELIKTYQNNPYGLLKKYCGFSNSDIMKQHIKNMMSKAETTYAICHQYIAEYEETISEIESKIPKLIKCFSKKDVLLMLGLQREQNWDKDVFPAYVFKQIDNQENEIRIEFNPTELYNISQYFR